MGKPWRKTFQRLTRIDLRCMEKALLNVGLITLKTFTSKKRNVGWLNPSLKSTETRKELSTTCILNKSYVKMPVST